MQKEVRPGIRRLLQLDDQTLRHAILVKIDLVRPTFLGESHETIAEVCPYCVERLIQAQSTFGKRTLASRL